MQIKDYLRQKSAVDAVTENKKRKEDDPSNTLLILPTKDDAFRSLLAEQGLVKAWVDERRKSIVLKSIFPICEIVGGKTMLLSDKVVQGPIERGTMILYNFDIKPCHHRENNQRHRNNRQGNRRKRPRNKSKFQGGYNKNYRKR